jgi:hypothetical protein
MRGKKALPFDLHHLALRCKTSSVSSSSGAASHSVQLAQKGSVPFSLKKNDRDAIVVNNKDCIDLMARFIKEKPALWNEDIAED